MARGGIYRRLLWPVYAPSTLFGVAAGATVPVQVVAAIHLGASASFAALVVALVGAVQLVTTVPAGRLIDRVGDRHAMLLASAAAALLETGSVIALAWGGPQALTLFVATSLLRAPATNVWGLARQAYVADRVATSELGRAMTGLGGTQRIGALVGPLLGGVLLLRLPLWSVYVLSVLCAALALAILYAPALGGRHERPARAGASAATASTEPGSASTEPGSASTGPGADQPAEAGADPVAVVDWTRVVLAGLAIVTLAVARACQPIVVQLWGVHVALTGAQISLLVAVGAAVEIVLMFPGGYLKDRLGRAVVLITCLVVYGAGFLLVVPLTGLLGLPGLVLAIVVMALGNGLGAGVNMTIGGDLSPRVGRGRFLGVWAIFSNVGALGGPLVVSVLVRAATVAAAAPAVGGIALLGAAWTALVARRVALPGPCRPGGPPQP